MKKRVAILDASKFHDEVRAVQHRLMAVAEAIDTANGALDARVAALEQRAEEVERAAELVRAAEKNWRVEIQARDHLILRSDAGEIARLPLGIASLVATGRPLDLDVAELDDDVIAFVRESVTVARIPRGLFLVLTRVLETWHARRGKTRSQSRARDGTETRLQNAAGPLRSSRSASSDGSQVTTTDMSDPDEESQSREAP